MPARVRPARRDDLVVIPTIEIAAATLFGTVDMDAIAEDDPPSLDELE